MSLDNVYASALILSQMTDMPALTEHHYMKLSVAPIDYFQVWRPEGFKKQKATEHYGKDQVHNWHRNYDVRPPNGESLEMCLQRAVIFFREQIEHQLVIGKHVMDVAPANSLRSMIVYVDKLTSQEIIDLESSTGVPMLYIYKEGKLIRRGGPLGSSEAGVYAYTEVAPDEWCRLAIVPSYENHPRKIDPLLCNTFLEHLKQNHPLGG